MDEYIYEEFDVTQITRERGKLTSKRVSKKVISEIALKIFVNDMEMVTLLCLGQYQKELALGFLYSEGVISSVDDIDKIEYNSRMHAVMVYLKEGIRVDKSESLRSVTSGCGKCYTYINPLKKDQYKPVESNKKYSFEEIINIMKDFARQSKIFIRVGGVHSALLHSPEHKIFIEDIGRHNCLDKITGMLVKERCLKAASESMIFLSGRVSSEIIAKTARNQIPILISRATPTTSAVRLAEQFNITLMGYVRNDKGYVYTCPERIIF